MSRIFSIPIRSFNAESLPKLTHHSSASSLTKPKPSPMIVSTNPKLSPAYLPRVRPIAAPLVPASEKVRMSSPLFRASPYSRNCFPKSFGSILYPLHEVYHISYENFVIYNQDLILSQTYIINPLQVGQRYQELHRLLYFSHPFLVLVFHHWHLLFFLHLLTTYLFL